MAGTVSYSTVIIPDGNHASIEIPDHILDELGANRRAPLKITVNGHTYQSTATGVGGQCRVVFPQRERDAAGVKSGETVIVQLELDSGRREVDIPAELASALKDAKLLDTFEALTYSKRKQFALLVSSTSNHETKSRRIEKIIAELSEIS